MSNNEFLSKIREEAQSGLTIDIKEADTCLLKLISLQERFCRHLTTAALKIRETEKLLSRLKKDRHKWYLTEYEVRLDRKEIQDYINSEPEVQKLEDQLVYWQNSAKYIEGVLDTIKQASYNTGSAIKWHMFKNGGV